MLTVAPGARVLDLGCAFGFGTRILAKRFHVEGRDLSPEYIARAKLSLPGHEFTCGPADLLPYPDASFDAVVLLDVLEHVPDEQAVITEVGRILKPGGELILSVPNRGILASFDSLNLYVALFGSTAPPPTDDPSWRISPHHRHYSLDAVAALLSDRFAVEVHHYTGVGLAEVINLILLILVRRWLRSKRLYEALQYLYFGAYILEDELSIGRWSYHLMIRARRLR